MKAKQITAVVAAAACAASLCACGGKSDREVFKVYMPDGAPAIAMAELMHSGYYATEFTVVPASTIGGRVSSGDADLAIMPVNAAAQLYNGGVDIVMLSVNTHGNLYFVGNTAGGLELDDLVNARVGVIGQGQVPDLTLRIMLDESGIDYEVKTDESTASGKVALRYAADGPALLPLLKQGKIDYAFLAEPAASNAVKAMAADGKAIVMDAQELWRGLFDSEYPQACLVAKSSLVENEPEYVKWFLRALQSSDGWATENADKAVAAVASHMEAGTETSLPATLGRDVIERCNISTVFADDAKATCTAYFTKLAAMTTGLGTPVLSSVPDDAFYLDGAKLGL